MRQARGARWAILPAASWNNKQARQAGLPAAQYLEERK